MSELKATLKIKDSYRDTLKTKKNPSVKFDMNSSLSAPPFLFGSAPLISF